MTEGTAPLGVMGARAAALVFDSANFHKPSIATTIPNPNPPPPEIADNTGLINSRLGTFMNNPFLAIQPFYEQEYDDWKEAGRQASLGLIGRFDMALIRCCDYNNEEEIAVNMHFFRFFFDFRKTKNVSTADGGLTVSEDVFKNEIIKNVNARWNGNTESTGLTNSRRTVLIPQDNMKIRVPVIWFAQSSGFASHSSILADATKDRDLSHFCIQVLPDKQGARDFRESTRGTGESQSKNFKDNNNFFTSAHECGHADSLPDEYNERSNAASYGQLSLSQNLSGDPFDLDGSLFVNPSGKGHSSLNNEASMMVGNKEIRNRHFWHSAEWIRHILGNEGFKVKYDEKYTDYFIPANNNPKASFTYNPFNSFHHNSNPAIPLNTGQLTNRGDVELFLYTLGREKYSNEILPKLEDPSKDKLYDGILVVVVKIKCNLNSAYDEDDRTNILVGMGQAMKQFNHKYFITGETKWKLPLTSRNGKTIPKEEKESIWKFNRCLIHFSPRYVVPDSPFDPNKDHVSFQPQNLITKYNPPFTIEIPDKRHAFDSDAEWVVTGIAKPAEVMSVSKWNSLSKTNTPHRQEISQAIQDYQNKSVPNNAPDLVPRINKLSDIINLCSVNESVLNTLKTQANNMRQYLISCGSSKTFRIKIFNPIIGTPNYRDIIKKNFTLFFPGMIGIYKSPFDITEADLKKWLTPAFSSLKIENTDVKKIL